MKSKYRIETVSGSGPSGGMSIFGAGRGNGFARGLLSCALAVSLGLLSVPCAADDETEENACDASFQAMVIHPTGTYGYHENDLDFGLTQNNIIFKHYAQEDTDSILEDMSNYSLIMCTPLVNINNIFGGSEEKVKEWIEKGNALVITDGCYSGLYRPFVEYFVENTDVDVCPCYGAEGFSHLFVRDVDPPHPMRCFPQKMDYESRQWWCLKAGSGWEVVSTCSGPYDVHPVTLMYPLGKGIVYLSSMQQRWKALPANLKANLMLRRIGLAPTAYSLSPLAVGRCKMHLELKNLSTPVPVQFTLKVNTGNKASDSGVKLGVNPDENGLVVADLNFVLRKAGPATLTLEARTQESGWKKIFEEKVQIEPTVSIFPPRYRGVLSTCRRTPDVKFEVAKPGIGTNAGFRAAAVAVYNPSGKMIGRGKYMSQTNVTFAAVSVRLPKLPAGENYRAVVKLPGGLKAATNFVVRAPSEEHPGETIIDEDGTLLVDGKPFFPLGIYHLWPGEYEEVKDIGFNTVFTLQWMNRQLEAFNSAQDLGLKVIYENNEKTLGGHLHLPAFHRDHPAFLMWYAPDEPGHEAGAYFASQLYDVYAKGDPYHPVVGVHYHVPRFALCAKYADAYAPEVYIYNGSDTKYTYASDLCDLARDAVERRKPVFMVPHSYGEPVEFERIVVWIGLAHDMRGFFWYAWDEGDGASGLKYHDDLKDGMRGLLSEIKELIPALVAPSRRPFVENDVHGIVCNDGKTVTYILVNLASDEERAVPEIPEFKNATPEALFGSASIDTPMNPLETRTYRCPVVKNRTH